MRPVEKVFQQLGLDITTKGCICTTIGVDVLHEKPECELHELEDYLYAEIARRLRTRPKIIKSIILHVLKIIRTSCKNEPLTYKIFGLDFRRFDELSTVNYFQSLEKYLSDELDKEEQIEKPKSTMKRAHVYYTDIPLYRIFEDIFIHEVKGQMKLFPYPDLTSFMTAPEADLFVFLVKNPGEYLDLIKAIDDKYPNAKIAVSSNVRYKKEIIEAIQHGATDYFFLPIKEQDISKIIGGVS